MIGAEKSALSEIIFDDGGPGRKGERQVADGVKAAFFVCGKGCRQQEQIFFDQIQCIRAVVDKCRMVCTSAEGLDTQGAGTGKEIEYRGLVHPIADNIEQGLPGPVGGRADCSSVGAAEPQALGISADDSQ